MRRIIGIISLGLLIIFSVVFFFSGCKKQQSYLDEALLTAEWIRNSAVQTVNGTTLGSAVGRRE